MTGVLSLAFRLIEPGANLHPLEAIPVYGCALWFVMVGSGAGEWGAMLQEVAMVNALLQFILFVIVVQIPCFLTGKMSNVDLAWPTGLVFLALQVLRFHFQNCNDGFGFHRRSFWVGLALLLHGGRMAMGAAYFFYPFDWPNGDLSRYQYAKKRWIAETQAPQLWWLKQQHETIMQAYANSVMIAAPMLLVATNPKDIEIWRPLEVIGLVSWLVFWILENMSDGQKMSFQKKMRSSNDNTQAVLGYPPHDGSEFWMWTKTRHPNYFCEWMCWNSFVIMAIPSALDMVKATDDSQKGTFLKIGIWILLASLSRMFYDCLVYWTGAGPAEQRSVMRRPLYKEYQKNTNVLVPISIPFLNHHRTPGWPHSKE